MQKRIDWIDYAKAIAIIGVVFLHVPIGNPFRMIASAIVVPLFFFLAGFFAKTNSMSTYKEFMKKRGLNILIPYLVFNFVNYLFWLFIARHYGSDSTEQVAVWQPLYGILYATSENMVHYIPLWFLSCLFAVETLYFFIRKYCTRVFVRWMLIIILLVTAFLLSYFSVPLLPWNVNGACYMLFFFAIGNSLKYILIKPISLRFEMGILALLFIFCGLLAGYLAVSTAEVKIYSNQYGNPIITIMSTVFGIISVISFAKILERSFPTIKSLVFVGRNTLIILCLHLTIGSFIKAFTSFILNLPLDIYQNLYVRLLYALGSLVLLVPFIWFINKYFPYLIGKKKLKD